LDTAVERRVRRRGDTLCHARPAGTQPPGRRRRRDDRDQRRCSPDPAPHHRRRRSPLSCRPPRLRAVADFRQQRSTPTFRHYFRFVNDVSGHVVDNGGTAPRYASVVGRSPALGTQASATPTSPTSPSKPPTNTDFRSRFISSAFQPTDNRQRFGDFRSAQISSRRRQKNI